MKFSKKIDTIYKKTKIPLFVSIIREKGEIKEIYFNNGDVLDLLYSRINNLLGSFSSPISEKNTLPYENKYLVVTISFLFDLYSDNTYKEGPLGIVAAKLNWKEKEDIIPAIFSTNDIEKKSSRLTLNLEDIIETCKPVVYDVDLLIYGKGIQYFKGNIGYNVITFAKINYIGRDSIDLSQDDENKCDNPIKIIYEQTGVELENSYSSITFHIIFYEN